MEVMNYGDNENGDHYSSGMGEGQVEDTDSEAENASEGYQSEPNGDYSSGMGEGQVEDTDSEAENASEGYQSEPNTILQPDSIPSTCFMLVSSSWLMHEVVKMVVIQVE
jgi:hypothetical protein